MTRFRVGVNLTWLRPGVVGGSEEYTMRLLQSLPEHLPDRIEVTLYGGRALFEAYRSTLDHYRLVTLPDGGSRPGRVLMENSLLAARSAQCDVMHHAGGTVPRFRRQPALVTVHDPQPLDMPENFHPLKRRWLASAIPHAVRESRLVLCPSRFTADRLIELLAVPEHKLRVVPHGHRPRAEVGDRAEIDPTGVGDGFGVAAGGAAVEPDRIGRRYGRFLLYPAIAYPHKRHIDVVTLLTRLPPQFDDLQVVFTGRAGPELTSVLEAAGQAGVGHRIHTPGRVPVAELQALYRRAAALVFPSTYEGFGNPALEAMSLGCPAIVSDAGALPEVVADAGLVFPARDVEAMAVAVVKVLSDAQLADDLRARGLARARSFDSGIAARRLAEVYGELAEM